MTIGVSLGACFVLFCAGVLVMRDRRIGHWATVDLMIADRRLRFWVAGLTLAATWIGGAYINGTAEAVYDPQRGIVWCQAPWCYALSLIVGGLVFARPMHRRGYRTMLDVFHDRYGPVVTRAMFFPALVGDVFWTSAILAALGTTAAALLGWDPAVAIIVSAGIVMAYTAWGGIWTVALSDILQLALVVAGLAICLPFVLERVGGLSTLLVSYRQQLGPLANPFPSWEAFTGEHPWGWQWLDFALLLICGGIPWQVYFQRILSCRSANTAVTMSILAGVICAAVALAPMVIGMAGVFIDWSALGQAPPATAGGVLPHVLAYAVPPVIGMMGLGALVMAVMSSMDSSILSSATMFTWNVYRPLAGRSDDDQQLQRVLRLSILALGTLTTVLALSVTSVYDLWVLSSDLVYVILFPQLVLALFSPRVSWQGAVAGFVTGLLGRIVLGVAASGGLDGLAGSGSISAALEFFPWRTCCMFASLLVILLGSGVWPPVAADRAARREATGSEPA